MRCIRNAVSATIAAIAFYFALTWGADAVHILTSPTYGLDDFRRAQDMLTIGRELGLERGGLVRLAAFLGAFKLVGAVAFALHCIDRARSFLIGKMAERDFLESALLLVILSTLAAALPAVIENNEALLRLYGLHLVLACVAAMLDMHEQRGQLGGVAQVAHSAAAAVADTLSFLASIERVCWAPLVSFVRRWRHDLRAAISGEPPKPVA